MDQATEIKEPLYGRDRRQAILVLLAFLIYSLLLASRYAFSASILSIEAYYGVSHADAGWAFTLFSIAYGVAQFFHTFFCKRYSQRFVITGILLAALGLVWLLFSNSLISGQKELQTEKAKTANTAKKRFRLQPSFSL